MTILDEIFRNNLDTFNNTIGSIDTNETTLKHYLTPAMLRKYESGEIGRETAVLKAVARFKKENEKQYRETTETMEKIQAAELPEVITIYVVWKRSATWGKNPHAVVYAAHETATGKASGCGYDKESSAVAAALNRIPACRAILADKKERYLSENGLKTVENHKAIGYGSGYGPIPAYEGGVGMSCLIGILRECGYTCRETHSKNDDTYIITRNY